MGIKAFHKWHSWVCKPAQQVNWSQWSGQRIGVDILGFVYKAKQEDKHPCTELADLIVLWRTNRIEPIFVFDGKPPSEKKSICSLRRRQKEQLSEEDRKKSCIVFEERNEVKQLLYGAGCIYLNATGEADTVLAYMARKGMVAAIVSMDMDFIARGCETLIVPCRDSWVQYSLQTILQESSFTYDQFVNLCVVLGSDYTPAIPSLSYQRVYWSIRYGSHMLEDILKKEGIRDTSLWNQAAMILRGEADQWSVILSEIQQEKWRTPPLPEWDHCVSLREKGILQDWTDERLRVLTSPIAYNDSA